MSSVRIKTPRERGAEVYEKLWDALKEYPVSNVVLKKAYDYAANCYCTRDYSPRIEGTADYYLTHAVRTAIILAETGDTLLLAGAILHDLPEVDRIYNENSVTNRTGWNVHELEKILDTTALSEMITSVDKVKTMIMEENAQENVVEKIIKCTEEVCIKRTVMILCAEAIDILKVYIKALDDLTVEARILEMKNEMKRIASNVKERLLPVVQHFKMHMLAEELEDLCLKIEQEVIYETLKKKYDEILNKNRDTYTGGIGAKKTVIPGVISFLERISEHDCFSTLLHRIRALNVSVEKRHIANLLQEELSKVNGLNNLEKYEELIAKEVISVYDIFFVTDSSVDTPENIFFACYNTLHDSRFRFTITSIEQTYVSNLLYYQMVDKYQNRYRLFIMSKNEYREYKFGMMETDEEAFTISDEEKNKKKILVYKRDGSPLLIDEGASALDFAFKVGKDTALCAYAVEINGKYASFSDILKERDKIDVKTHYYKDNRNRNIYHANVKWMEHLYIRDNIRMLARWLAGNMEISTPEIDIIDAKTNKKYKIQSGSTFLDVCFLIEDPDKAMCVKRAFVNKDMKSVGLDEKVLSGTRVAFEYESEGNIDPPFSWICFVKTERAKNILFEFFDKKYNS